MRKSKENLATDKESALEIIELATSDFESLTKAFNLIADVCRHQDSQVEEIQEVQNSEIYIH